MVIFQVFLGYARCLKNSEKKDWVKVAVKELKGSGSPGSKEYQAAFCKEVKALTEFKHRNIISLLGIGVRYNIERYILMEFMNEGSLKDFLLSIKAEKFQGDSCRQLEKGHYIYMAAQVSDAMSYLEHINAVHRDLAARNCLVNSSLVVKVCWAYAFCMLVSAQVGGGAA